ncbi:MAG: hypothetical protein KIS67_01090 [Verrucomicrobiae bacterium]|nr:hypothetical protein [Verrucomicrobiae bacterium]
MRFHPDSRTDWRGVTNGNHTSAYTYLANGPVLGQLPFQSNTVPRMTST